MYAIRDSVVSIGASDFNSDKPFPFSNSWSYSRWNTRMPHRDNNAKTPYA